MLGRLRAGVETLARPAGRPAEPKADNDTLVGLAKSVISFLKTHPGCCTRTKGHTLYHDEFRRFVVGLFAAGGPAEYPLRQPRSSHHEAPYLRCPHGKASQHTNSPIPYPRSSSTTAPLPSRFAPSQPNPLVNDETQDQSLSPAPNQYT